MFSDRAGETGVDITSSWKTEISLSQAECQTLDLDPLVETGCQTGDCRVAECQTESSKSEDKSADVDYESLAKFLESAVPLIEEEMEGMLGSRAWDGWGSWLGEEGEESQEVSLANTVETGEGWRISHLIWNYTGSLLFVGLSHDHSSWCNHEANLQVYRVDDILSGQHKLVQTVSVPACVSALASHPWDPLQVCVGCYSGDIMVCRLDKEVETEIMMAGDDRSDSERQPVVSVHWLDRSSLVSVQSGGRLNIINIKKGQLDIVKTFLITASHLPRSIKSLRSTEVGLRNSVLSEDDQSTLIIGTEAGLLIITDLNSEVRLPLDTEETCYDPVISVHSLHKGAVTDIQISPYDDNILVSTGEDLKLHLLSLVQPHSPVLSYQLDLPITSITWSSTRPSLLAAASSSGVLLFDFLTNKTGPVLKIKSSERHRTNIQPLTTISFPARSGSSLAAGDKFGRLYLWNLPSHYSGASAQEKYMFQNIPYALE